MKDLVKQKKPIYKQWWLWVIVAFIVLGGIGALLDEGESSTDGEKVQTSAPVEKKKEPTKVEKTPDQVAADFIKKKFGSNKEEKKKAVVESTFENGVLNATALEGSILTANIARKTFWMDTTDLMEQMKKMKDVQTVNFVIQLPLTDQYGNEEVEDVMKIQMTRETLDKINFDKFDWNNLPEVADSYWEHPAFKN